MTSLAEWLNIRRNELRPFTLAFVGAFLALSFVVLTRSLREAFFLSTYEIQRLPWMIAAVVAGSLPAVLLFGRLLNRARPALVVVRVALLLACGLAVLWRWLPDSRAAILVFYLWTAVGSLLLTSGFWTVLSEVFPLRGAKRLFSLIGAGGTAGAMVAGISLTWLVAWISLEWIVALVILQLILFAGVMHQLFRCVKSDSPAPAAPAGASRTETGSDSRLLSSGRTVWEDPHLRTIALLIFLGTLIMTLVDFQFKDLARAAYRDEAQLIAFFGSFYGWAGLVSLLLQLVGSSRLLERAGIAGTLAVSPVLMIGGAVGLLLAPGLWLVTLVRGTDYTLRKALFRPAVEVFYVPVPQAKRRLTKSFIDTLVDSSAEGLGAVLILLWLSVLGLPARFLSVPVLIGAGVFLLIVRRIDRSYFRSVTDRLQEEEGRFRDSEVLPAARDLLGATFTSLDLSGLIRREEAPEESERHEPAGDPVRAEADSLLAELSSPEDQVVLAALSRVDATNPEHLDVVTRLVARDDTFRRVIALVQEFHRTTVPPLIEILQRPDTDFIIRRRIPEVFAKVGGAEADDALLDLLTDSRFEVRYRAAVALAARRRAGLETSRRDWHTEIWLALTQEVRKERPLWELQKLLDEFDHPDDELISARVGVRGELSLEHTFRLLTLVLDPEEVRAAYLGVVQSDPSLKSFALEYLELVLPRSVRQRLWLFIGDVSDRRKARQLRPVEQVVADMMATGVTLFQGDVTRLGLRRLMADPDTENPDDGEN